MMEDQRNSVLKEYYREANRRIKIYLEESYDAVSVDKANYGFPSVSKDDKYSYFKLSLHDAELDIVFIIAIPNYFPDVLPKIFLSKDDFSKLPAMPHVGKDRLICTRDPSLAFINEEKQEEAVDRLIQIARQIIKQGLKRENISEFEEEFLAYWNEQAKIGCLSIWAPSDEIEVVKLFGLKHPEIAYSYIISTDIREAVDWIKLLGLEINEVQTLDAIHVPLSKPISLPLPENNYDIHNLIAKAGKTCVRTLETYLNKDDKNRVVLASFSQKGDRILIGWIYAKWTNSIFRGFRTDKLPLLTRMQRTASAPIEKISIERTDPNRLFNRGSIGPAPLLKNASISIIGCGSLGSHLAISLSKSGFSHFLLIDKEELEPGNVARHACGLDQAIRRPPKSKALKDKITAHFPHIECLGIQADILEELEKNETLLNKYNLVIIAIGNTAIERRINYLFLNKIITVPLAFLWIEPFGVAGHLLYIHPKGEACFQCCFQPDGSFKYAVAKRDNSFNKRESGCQSTFIPYSNLEIDGFVNMTTRWILRCIEERPEQSLLYTWLGDMKNFNKMGYGINDEWITNRNFSTYERLIRKNDKCSACAK